MTDAVYRDRAVLLALLATEYPSHIGETDLQTPGWPVLTLETPRGQMCWHIAPGDRDLFRHVRATEERDRAWDGHTPEDKEARLLRLIGDRLTVTTED